MNKYRVAKRQWAKWNKAARFVFNEVYGVMCGSQLLFKHPDAAEEIPEQWKTTCWNAAWIAADATMGEKKSGCQIIDCDEHGRPVRGAKPRLLKAA